MKQRVILLEFVLALALIFLSIVVQAPTNPYWFDTSWHFRTNFTINNTDYSRNNWPIEIDMNFTDLIQQTGKNGTFNTSSIRLIEHNSTWGVMYPIKHQFDISSDFDNSTNANGVLIFLMNGTTAANATRYYSVYFDIAENGEKNDSVFSSNLNYSWDGEEAYVNNSIIFQWRIDTSANENLSGIYNVRAWDGGAGNILSNSSGTPIEYIQYSNGTNNFSFDFRNNATFTRGPIRLIMEQTGNETFWNNPNMNTGFGRMKKKYIFYDDIKWMKIEQNFTNIGGSSITRNSSIGGALSINDLTYNGLISTFGNESNPLSRYGASSGGSGVGIINLNYSQNANYSAAYHSGLDRIGITLNTTTIASGESISETAVLQFDDINYNDPTYLLPLKNQLLYPPIITHGSPQFIPYIFDAEINYTLYNRNETILIWGNTTYDPYSIVSSVNATLDMGTATPSDDVVVVLYDDGGAEHGDESAGDLIFSNLYNLSNSGTVGIWNVTIKAYDSDNVLINQSNTSFNLTDQYNVSLNITNPDGYVDRMINATINVRNARLDTFIGGATINCSYGAGPLNNITDYNNGTYLLNFTAPSTTGNYGLNCSALKFNNTGGDSQNFSTQTSETEMTLNLIPQNHSSANITIASGDWLNLSVNATDIGGANAFAVNLSLSLPQNLTSNSTFEACNTVNMGTSCIRMFNITINNRTYPGNYTLNVSVAWENPDTTTNSTNTSFTVYVLSNPVINVTPQNISGTAPDGITKTIGNFSVYSIGNDNLTNITFNVTGLSNFTISFNPENLSLVAPDTSEDVFINITIPVDYLPGNYNGTINISSENDGWKTIELNITVPSKTNTTILNTPQNYTSSVISFSTSDLFNITVNTSNTGPGNAKDVNITISTPLNLSSNSSFETCGNITVSTSCIKVFDMNISNQTIPGTYIIEINSTWRNPDSSINYTSINFTVNITSNPILNTSEDGITTIMQDNSTILAGNFTVYSIGNDNLTNITFNVTGLSNFTIVFSPSNISSLEMNASQTVLVNVSVPFAYSPGNYTGTINASSDGGWKTFDLNVSVSTRREWSRTPGNCERSENPETGTVCLVTLENTGNMPVNITINPVSTNYTSVNETNMTVLKNSSYIIEFLYNVTNITKAYYYENYTINATNADASPTYYDFNITLVPYIVPLFSFNITPNETEQDSSIEIYANITDRSTTGINWTRINITLPNGTLETHNMSLLLTNGTTSLWFFNYSGNMSAYNISNYTGSTLQRGLYNITLFSQDNTGVVGEQAASINIYAKFLVGFYTKQPEYYQGSKGSIHYTLTDAAGVGLEGANVTIIINDSSGNITYHNSFTTSSNGLISPTQSFELMDDASTGIHNLTANMTYYDSITNKTLTSLDNASFEVKAGSTGGGGGLESNVRTTVVWYPDNVMQFEMWFTYAGNVTTPDNMSLKVYDPANNIYFSITLDDVNQTSPGIYRYQYAMPVSTASGYYRAELRASKDGFEDPDIEPFRVAKGGPYDVRVTVIPPLEVPRQDYLSFEVFLENMGEVTQDVYIDYWTSYGNNTYYYGGEAVLTPIGTNTTVTRTAYIFANQPLGINTLNVKVTYDNVQAPIILNTTFEVIDEDFEIPPPPWQNQTTVPPDGGVGSGSGGGGIIERIVYIPAEETPQKDEKRKTIESNIEIEKYNKEINIVRGWTALESVNIKNTGNNPLTNITLSLSGIPSLWFKITPEKYETLPSGNDTLFLIEFKIPNNVDSGSYGLTFTAGSNEDIDEKVGRVVIFTSIEELVAQDILTLKIELEKLEDDTDYSERIGKDVSKVRDLIDQAREQIRSAENNLKKKSFDDALLNTQTASGLIRRGKRLLEVPLDLPPTTVPAENPWIFGLKVLLIIIIIASVALWSIKSKNKLNIKQLKAHFKKNATKGENDERKKELEDEKAKTTRMLKLIENELKEGIITENAYNELKKRDEEKLARIEKSLKKL